MRREEKKGGGRGGEEKREEGREGEGGGGGRKGGEKEEKMEWRRRGTKEREGRGEGRGEERGGEEGRKGEDKKGRGWEWNVSCIVRDIMSMVNILSIHSQRSPATRYTACPLSELTETAWRKVSVHQYTNCLQYMFAYTQICTQTYI